MTDCMNVHSLPNLITIFRLILVLPFLLFLLNGDSKIAFYLFVAAGASDAVDGCLARQFKWTSRLGAFLDPIADKLLLMGSFIGLAYLDQIPIWLAAIVIARDIIIVLGAIAYARVVKHIDFVPSLISKVNTVCQVLLVFLFLEQYSFFPLPTMLLQLMVLTVVVTTLWSLADYMWVWGRRAYERAS